LPAPPACVGPAQAVQDCTIIAQQLVGDSVAVAIDIEAAQQMQVLELGPGPG
jgi:hypothetical protein